MTWLGKISRVAAANGFALALACGMIGSAALAQTQPPAPLSAAAIGSVTGADISVVGPSGEESATGAGAVDFTNGGTIVVHSGQARVEFAGGGELDVCGPAKFTVLASGNALTIALSFGRVHVKVDSTRPISIYTPLIIATPMALQDQARDVTLGVANTGAMCVLASNGAVQVQQQLSGETLIVPQPSEVFIRGVPFGASNANVGSCRCEFDEANATQAPAPPIVSPNPALQTAPEQNSPPAAFEGSKGTESQSAAKPSASAANSPIAKIEPPEIPLPPVRFDVKSPLIEPQEMMSEATLLLAKESQVEPAWTFHGVVAAPPSLENLRNPAAMAETGASAPPRKSRGFWRKIYHALFSW